MEKQLDMLLPSEMALKAEEIGVQKANMDFMKTFVLSILAGAFIAFGAIFSTLVTAGSTWPYGITKLIGGLAFGLGLMLTILGGAELFTGNNLIVMAWANKKISTCKVLRNWLIVYLGNAIGACCMVVLIVLSGHFMQGKGAVGLQMLLIAKAKCDLPFINAFCLGILCNILVCLAVWLSYSAKDVSGKVICIMFPVSAFVAAGFEHSIANMYYVPLGIILKNYADPEFWQVIQATSNDFSNVNIYNFIFKNLIPVTIGNIIGGAVLVSGVYWFVFLKNKMKTSA